MAAFRVLQRLGTALPADNVEAASQVVDSALWSVACCPSFSLLLLLLPAAPAPWLAAVARGDDVLFAVVVAQAIGLDLESDQSWESFSGVQGNDARRLTTDL